MIENLTKIKPNKSYTYILHESFHLFTSFINIILFISNCFKHKIIQWNCRGLKPKFDEISIILEQQNHLLFFLQETFLKPKDNVTLKGFNIYLRNKDMQQTFRVIVSMQYGASF